MNISNLISYTLALPIDHDFIVETVEDAYPNFNKSAQATIVSGLYHILDEARWSCPDVYRFQLEKVLGECDNFQEWFDLTSRQKLELFIQLEKFLMETNLTGIELGDEVYYQLVKYKEAAMEETAKKCHACGHPVEDIRLGDLCAACTNKAFEDEACDGCGDRESDLDSDNLCQVCAYAQLHYDNGKCPLCEAPSPGSRACAGC